MENVIQEYLETQTPNIAVKILCMCIENKHYAIGIELGQYFISIYVNNIDIHRLLAQLYYINSMYHKSYKIYNRILSKFIKSEREVNEIIEESHKCIKHICDNFTTYNEKIVSGITRQDRIPGITVTITSCKRLDLYKQTINSVLTYI